VRPVFPRTGKPRAAKAHRAHRARFGAVADAGQVSGVPLVERGKDRNEACHPSAPMYALMPDDPPYILDIEGIEEDGPDPSPGSQEPRKWIGVQFECCGVYARVYRNEQATAYVGYCPRCARPVRVRIGPGGTRHRMFRAW